MKFILYVWVIKQMQMGPTKIFKIRALAYQILNNSKIKKSQDLRVLNFKYTLVNIYPFLFFFHVYFFGFFEGGGAEKEGEREASTVSTELDMGLDLRDHEKAEPKSRVRRLTN